jgi:hypothetical protein
MFYQKIPNISCYDEHGIMILYDDNVSLTDNITMTHLGAKFITTLFNNNTHDALYIIIVYKPPKMQLSHFNYVLETFIHKRPSNCPTVIIGDLLTNTIQSTTLQAFMKKYNFKLTFSKSITFSDTQIDHIWTNASIQQCYFASTQAYWIDHKLIYLAFKLPDYVPQIVLPQ